MTARRDWKVLVKIGVTAPFEGLRHSAEAPIPTIKRMAFPGVVPNLPLPSAENSLLRSLQESVSQNAQSQSILAEWDANEQSDNSGLVMPADPDIAVSSAGVVSVVNRTIESFDKSGAKSGANIFANQTLQSFFGSITGSFDPIASYDHFTDRIVVATDELDQGAQLSNIYIAASPAGSIPAATGWNGVTYDVELPIGPLDQNGDPTDCWLDYPQMTVDEEAIYITGNYFSYGFSFCGQRLIIIDKATLYAGGAPTATVFDPAGTSSLK